MLWPCKGFPHILKTLTITHMYNWARSVVVNHEKNVLTVIVNNYIGKRTKIMCTNKEG